ncbi:hypothetical protein MNBD_GAMMA07-2125 [hydrothermal vent metagenome]|uniref:Uncharacterized protein n=1 Tax=hydrothermal vent metagenome TaxID=652676 RepID=A0A3B0XKP1_9ZZZZ
MISRSNALRWNATTSGGLSLNGSNEMDYMVYEFPRRTVGTRNPKHFNFMSLT